MNLIKKSRIVLALHFGHNLILGLYLTSSINIFKMFNTNFNVAFKIQILRGVSRRLVECCAMDCISKGRPPERQREK